MIAQARRVLEAREESTTPSVARREGEGVGFGELDASVIRPRSGLLNLAQSRLVEAGNQSPANQRPALAVDSNRNGKLLKLGRDQRITVSCRRESYAVSLPR